MLPIDLQQALMASGPGTSLVMEVNGDTAFVAVDQAAAVQDLRGLVNIELRVEGYAGKEGAAVRLRALFYVQPLLTMDSYLDPTQSGDLALLERLTHQETFAFHFFAPGRFDKPILQKQIPWRSASRDNALQVLAQMEVWLGSHLGGSFAAAKIAMQRRDELPPVDVLTSGEEQILRMLENPPVGPRATPSYTSPLGIGWGDPAGPQIDVFSLGGRIPHVPDALCLAGAAWQSAPEEMMAKLSGGGKQWRGVVAAPSEGERVVLRYAWPRAQDPFTGLRDLVEKQRREGKIVPWSIIAALYVALQARKSAQSPEQWGQAVAPFLLTFGELPAGLSPVPPAKELEAQAHSWNGHPSALPDNPYARARFLWAAGQHAWELSEAVAATTLNPLATAAGVFLAAQAWPWRVKIGAAGYLQPAEATVSNAIVTWFLACVLRAQPLPAAVDFLLPGRKVLPNGTTPIEEPPSLGSGELIIPLPENPAFLRALAQEMVEEAATAGIYGPAGPFRVRVPAETLLSAWGIEEIRAWVEKEGIWAGLVVSGGRVAAVLRWQPGQTLGDSLMAPTWAEAALEVALAALWRDLHVGGAQVFRERGAAAPARVVAPPDEQPPARPRARHARTLPQPRLVQPYPRASWPLPGRLLEWGSDEERELIRRLASRVRGHPRYLGLYVSECRLSVLQVLAGSAPVDAWRERMRQARDRRDEEEAEWWTTLLNAAGDAAAQRTARDQEQVVEAILEGASRRCASSRLHRWLRAGLEAIAEVERHGVAEELSDAAEKARTLRQAARERAEREGALPPAVGWTYVRGYVPTGAAAEDAAAQAQVVRLRGLRGLLVVQATLGQEQR